MSARPENTTARRIRSLASILRRLPAGRRRDSLPWRKTRDPYHLLVSEVMLQQTQVDRVVPFYKRFLKAFPTARVLARAPLSAVLRLWQGLGYNRRAKMLHDAAKTVMIYHNSQIPRAYEDLRKLPGVGDYTAKAVRVFAFNEPELMIETNIRTVFIHHFSPKKKNVSDKDLLPYMIATLDRKNPRKWYATLMDYGTYLKKTLPNPSRRSAHHAKQKSFKGSDREIRGSILKAHLAGVDPRTLPFDRRRVSAQLAALRAEGLVDP